MKRRNFLKKSLVATGVLGLGKYVYADNQIPQSGDPPDYPTSIPANLDFRDLPHYQAMITPVLTTYIEHSQDSAVWIRWKNKVVTCYRAEALQKYPYFYPLRALKSGLSLVTETGEPYPHHRGVFFGLEYDNGRNNYWSGDPFHDRIESKKLELGVCTEKSAEILNDCLWIPFEKEPIFCDKRRFVLTILDDETYTLDIYYELTALTEVVLGWSKHGFFGVRTEDDLSVNGGGILLNSEGQQMQVNTHEKYARWMTSYGKRYGRNDGLVEGLAIMSPPCKRSPFDRNIWFTRNYGNYSPMPFNTFAKDEKFIMPKDDVLRLAYRIVAFTGVPTNSFLNAQWDEFAAISESKRS